MKNSHLISERFFSGKKTLLFLFCFSFLLFFFPQNWIQKDLDCPFESSNKKKNGSTSEVEAKAMSACLWWWQHLRLSTEGRWPLFVQRVGQRLQKSKLRLGARPRPTTVRPAAEYTPSDCMEEAAPSSTCSPELPSCPGCREEAPGSPAHPRCQPCPCGIGTPRKMEGKRLACREHMYIGGLQRN